MAITDITTLASVKNYLAFKTPAADSVLQQLITAESRNFLFLTRWETFYPTTVTRQIDGTNTDVIMITDRPLTAVSAITINGTLSIPPSPGLPQWGYQFDTWGRIVMVGGRFASIYGGWYGSGGVFPRGRKNISITYTFGFPPVAVTNEIQVVPCKPLASLVTPNLGPYYTNQGVTYLIGGNPLSLVVGFPQKAGQYTVTASGQYQFHSSDGGLQVLINYNYLSILENIAQCVNEMVGYKYAQRGNLNISSETIIGQQQAVYLRDYPDTIKKVLCRYERKYGGTANASAGW